MRGGQRVANRTVSPGRDLWSSCTFVRGLKSESNVVARSVTRRGRLIFMWRVVEVAVGLFLVVVASAVIVRPNYRLNRVLLGVAATSWAVGLVGVVDGLRA